MHYRWFCLRGRYSSFKIYLFILISSGFLFCVFFMKSLGQLDIVQSTPTQPAPPPSLRPLKHVSKKDTPDVAKLRQQWLKERIERFSRKHNADGRNLVRKRLQGICYTNLEIVSFFFFLNKMANFSRLKKTARTNR